VKVPKDVSLEMINERNHRLRRHLNLRLAMIRRIHLLTAILNHLRHHLLVDLARLSHRVTPLHQNR
jgi:hypothetical protein